MLTAERLAEIENNAGTGLHATSMPEAMVRGNQAMKDVSVLLADNLELRALVKELAGSTKEHYCPAEENGDDCLR